MIEHPRTSCMKILVSSHTVSSKGLQRKGLRERDMGALQKIVAYRLPPTTLISNVSLVHTIVLNTVKYCNYFGLFGRSNLQPSETCSKFPLCRSVCAWVVFVGFVVIRLNVCIGLPTSPALGCASPSFLGLICSFCRKE